MKIKTICISCLTCMIILVTGYEYSQAQQQVGTTSNKIGIVSISEIFKSSTKSVAHKREINAEQSKKSEELKRLSEQLKAEEAMLMVLKQDSSDYLVQREKCINIRVRLEAQQTINKEHTILKQYRWRKRFYQDILRITSELAEQKGLDVVLEKDKIDIPALSVNELNQTMITHKVLYSGGCMDITREIIARLDKEK